ncbi:MAG: AAA family ATPase, partial [Anaerolineaceae bacterium]|nr:AAA family ATPase [Anaerolineaceae bacterium]
PELRNIVLRTTGINRNNSLAHIVGPRENEINRLIQYYGKNRSLAVDESDLETLTRWMAAEGQTVRYWLRKLERISRLDIENARKNGWFSGSQNSEISVDKRLDQLIGLTGIKDRIMELTAWLKIQKIKGSGSTTDTPVLHMVFAGNPGTGKTTIARMIGEIYRDLGLLHRGHFVEAKACDLVAEHVGGTALKTNSLIERALDGVLFIDEAYMLTESDRGGFGQEALDTLLMRMENDRGRLVVIAAGYPEKMRKYVRSNPGLPRRFSGQNIFYFPDFNPDELWQILAGLFADKDLKIPDKMVNSLKEIISDLYATRDETFGNAGEMRNFAEGIERCWSARIVKNGLSVQETVGVEDIPVQYGSHLRDGSVDLEEPFRELNDLVGLEPVKNFITLQAGRVYYDAVRKKHNPEYALKAATRHLLFIGNPGTGKTTVARLLGNIYKDLGILRKGHVVEVTGADLVAGYVGQTAIMTNEKVLEALDGIMFIDEAYSLSRGKAGSFGQEAIDTLVKAIEKFQDRLVVIAAGYNLEMEQFIASNPGLRSRFAPVIAFHDYGNDELLDILRSCAKKENFVLSMEIEENITNLFQHMRCTQGEHFGNARTAVNLFEHMKNKLAERFMRVYKLMKSEAFDDEYFQHFQVFDVQGFMNDDMVGENEIYLEIPHNGSKAEFPDFISVDPLRINSL